MSTSFSTALSGLNAFSTAIDVVGNNLANLDTTGFKTDGVEFQDLVTQSIGADLGATQVGFGVGTPITMTNFSQGALESTGGALDAAIQGQGFFIVNANGSGNTEYTRGGSFEVNTAGYLTTASGDLVQGWSMNNGVVNTNAPIGNISVPVGQLAPPLATQNISASLNLDASAASGTNFSTSIQVYDSLGNAHTVTMTFTQSGTPNQWNYSVSVPGSDLTAGTYTPVTGTLTFDSNGNLTDPAPGAPVAIPITGLADNAADLNLTWNLYNGTTPDITQYAQSSATSAQSQDGKAAADLVSVGLANGGQVLAQYSDGTQVVVGQMAMAQIENPDSLVAAGSSNYQASALTALPAIGIPGTGGRGTVVGGSTEGSNVNIATEFTNLIVYQQGYQANAHMVTTQDTLSQDTINMTQGA
ncbi:MAG TPA: flagellar hook protein FlgE [Bryobacteraceae bacterium]|nr:flagellar hook protein FlgE [Bryobacteraceae bacterium]